MQNINLLHYVKLLTYIKLHNNFITKASNERDPKYYKLSAIRSSFHL